MTTRAKQALKFGSRFGSNGFGARIPMRRRDFTVPSSPSTAAPSKRGAPGGAGINTMDGGVPGKGTPELLASKLLVVLEIPVGDVVSDVFFSDI